MKKYSRKNSPSIVGLDLGDKHSQTCSLNKKAEVLERVRMATTKEGLTEYLSQLKPTTVVIEVGTHSPWVSRLLKELGHKVIVANAWRVQLIHKSLKKNDKRDAEFLARLGLADIKLLAPLEHRGERTQAARVMLSSRNALVEARTKLINHVRGTVKSVGDRLPRCSADAFSGKTAEQLPELLTAALSPLLETIGRLTEEIRRYEARLARLSQEEYPQTEQLRQVPGVGPLTALAYVLTIENPARFAKSREVGPYLGLVPIQSSSGAREPQLRITKAGDDYLRKLLVSAAQFILGPFGKDCELRRFGEALFKRGGKNAKKRAIVAVARKLAVLLHRLWVGGAVYDPFYQQNRNGSRWAVKPAAGA